MSRSLKVGAGLLVGCAALGFWIVHLRAQPRHDHEHCIVIAGGLLLTYASEHGHYPYSTNGYGDAIVLAVTNKRDFVFFTAEGYSTKAFENALEHGRHVSEKECGRVYVQGVAADFNGDVARLFDKKSSRGVRETDLVGRVFIKDADWPAFAKRQIGLPIEAGISQEQAERYYAEAK